MPDLWCAAIVLMAGLPQQEEPRQEEPKEEKTVTVTATRLERDILDVPRSLNVIEEERLEERGALSVLDAVDDQPGVWVEKRTTTTSDIVMRGLSGSNILALIDGNTLSTFWGEGGFAGDDMYGKVDADSVERIEIIRGPASVLYGSNAMGGVVNFITRRCPLPYPSRGVVWGSRSRVSFGSAAEEYRVREEVYAAWPQVRLMVGASLRDVHDARGGGDVGVQEPSGGQDLNQDLSFEFRTGERSWLDVGLQRVDRDKVRRFYKPTEENFNDRWGAGATWKSRAAGPLWDEVEARVYYQYKKDRRHWESTDVWGTARWQTVSLGGQVAKSLPGGHALTCGVGAEGDDGESPDDEQFTRDLPTGTVKAAPDSRWIGVGAYAQDEWDVTSDLRLVASVRVDRFWFDTFVDDLYVPPGPWDPELDEISETQDSLTGGVGMLVGVTEGLRAYANAYRGYRLWPPRFGATKQAWGVVVPSGLLPPVVGDTGEIGVKGEMETASFSGALYRTWFRNWQVIEPGEFQGSTWFDWDADTVQDADETVYVTRDVGHAYVYGTELGCDLRLWKVWDRAPEGLHLKTAFAWNIGKNRWNNEPIRHTAPANAAVTLRWEDPSPASGLWFEFVAQAARYYDRVPSDRLANDPGYRVNPQDMTSPLVRPWGLPGYTVMHVRGGARLSKNAELTFGVENLGDRKYRRAHSRWDEVGINALVGVTVTLGP